MSLPLWRHATDHRVLLNQLCESQRTPIELESLCHDLLEASPIRADRLMKYLTHFVEA